MDKVLIIDFGSQVTQLIARRIREIGVYCEIYRHDCSEKEIVNYNAKAVILSGGPESVNDSTAPKINDAIWRLNVPVLGICYGQQAICEVLGGTVSSSTSREFGKADIEVVSNSLLFQGLWSLNSKVSVWMSHSDHVAQIPKDFKVFARSKGAPFAIIGNEEKKIYGVQFHPEVSHTTDGTKLLENFIRKVAGCIPDWKMDDFIETQVSDIKKQVGKSKVICGLSGGIDSAVAALLTSRAIGDQLTCIFVDNGLLRKNESQEVIHIFKDMLNLNLIFIDASHKFLKRLEGVFDPEEKRKIIGTVFIEVFEQIAEEIGGIEYLVQGTLYPDIIESVSSMGNGKLNIKSHHNVGGIPNRKLNFKILEPLKSLFKDEVRKLAKILNLPDNIVLRHPFPGPGLGIRVLSDVTQEKCDILREVDYIYVEELKKHGFYNQIWQAFSVLLPVKTVGVMGDSRTYEYVCALRAVTSVDGMTADYFELPYSFLGFVSRKIVNEVKGINRVVYDITSKPPATIEWE